MTTEETASALPELSLLAFPDWQEQNQATIKEPLQKYRGYSDYVKQETLAQGRYSNILVQKLDAKLAGLAIEAGDYTPAEGTEPLVSDVLARPKSDELPLDSIINYAYSSETQDGNPLRTAAANLKARRQLADEGRGTPEELAAAEADLRQLATPDLINAATRKDVKEGNQLAMVIPPADPDGAPDVFLNKSLLEFVNPEDGSIDTAALGKTLKMKGTDPSLIPAILTKLTTPSGYSKTAMELEMHGDELSTLDALARTRGEDGQYRLFDELKKVANSRERGNSYATEYGEFRLKQLTRGTPLEGKDLMTLADDFNRMNEMPEIDEADPSAALRTLSTGAVVAPLNLMLNEAAFTKALDSVPPAQRPHIQAQRDYAVESSASDVIRTLADAPEGADEFVSYLDAQRAEGKKDSQIVKDWVAQGKYSSTRTMLQGIRSSLGEAVMPLVALATGADPDGFAIKAMQGAQIEDANRRAVADLFGKPVGMGYDLTRLVAPVAVDLGVSFLTRGAAVGATAAAKATAGAAVKSLFRTALTSETRSLVGAWVRSSARSGIKSAGLQATGRETVDEVVSMAGRDITSKIITGTSKATFYASAFNRTAMSTYASLSTTLAGQTNPDGSAKYSPGEVKEISMTHGLAAGAITVGAMGAMAGVGIPGIEKVFNERLTRGQLNKVWERFRKDVSKLPQGADMSSAQAMVSSMVKEGVRPIFSTKTLAGKAGNVLAALPEPVKGALSEAPEEALDEFMQYFNEAIATGDKIDIRKAASTALYSALLGGAMGGTVTGITSTVLNRTAPLAQVEADIRRERLLEMAGKLEATSPQTAQVFRNYAFQQRQMLPQRQQLEGDLKVAKTPEAKAAIKAKIDTLNEQSTRFRTEELAPTQESIPEADAAEGTVEAPVDAGVAPEGETVVEGTPEAGGRRTLGGFTGTPVAQRMRATRETVETEFSQIVEETPAPVSETPISEPSPSQTWITPQVADALRNQGFDPADAPVERLPDSEMVKYPITKAILKAEKSPSPTDSLPEGQVADTGAATVPTTADQLRASISKLQTRYTPKQAEKIVANFQRLNNGLPATEELHEYRVAGFVTRNRETGRMTLHVTSGEGKSMRVAAESDVTDQYLAPVADTGATPEDRVELDRLDELMLKKGQKENKVAGATFTASERKEYNTLISKHRRYLFAKVTPENDTEVGTNAAGETLYEQADGQRYRMRFDSPKTRPNGYPDFGGDLAPTGADTLPGFTMPPRKRSLSSMRDATVDKLDTIDRRLARESDEDNMGVLEAGKQRLTALLGQIETVMMTEAQEARARAVTPDGEVRPSADPEDVVAIAEAQDVPVVEVVKPKQTRKPKAEESDPDGKKPFPGLQAKYREQTGGNSMVEVQVLAGNKRSGISDQEAIDATVKYFAEGKRSLELARQVPTAVGNKAPFSVTAFNEYGLSLPDGYVRQGDLYVYQPDTTDLTPGTPITFTSTAVPGFAEPTQGTVERVENGRVFARVGRTVIPGVTVVSQAESQANQAEIKSEEDWRFDLVKAEAKAKGLTDEELTSEYRKSGKIPNNSWTFVYLRELEKRGLPTYNLEATTPTISDILADVPEGYPLDRDTAKLVSAAVVMPGGLLSAMNANPVVADAVKRYAASKGVDTGNDLAGLALIMRGELEADSVLAALRGEQISLTSENPLQAGSRTGTQVEAARTPDAETNAVAVEDTPSADVSETFVEGEVTIEDFDIGGWLNGDWYPGVPRRPDNYRPGATPWGKDPAKGQATKRNRSKKAHDTNVEFFNREVFPLIAGKVDKDELFRIYNVTGNLDALRKSEYRLWKKGDKQSWLPKEDPKEAQAIEMGATIDESVFGNTPRNLPSSTPSSAVTAELNKFGFSEGLPTFLANVSKKGGKQYAPLAKLLLDAGAGNVDIRTVNLPNTEAAGFYVGANGVVHINTAKNGPRGAVDTVLHELVHAVTEGSLRNPTPEQAKVIARIERVRVTVTKRAKANGTFDNDLQYALGDNAEFLTHFFTSQRFRDQVSAMTPKSEKNWLQVIADLIADLFTGRTKAQKMEESLRKELTTLITAPRTGLAPSDVVMRLPAPQSRTPELDNELEKYITGDWSANPDTRLVQSVGFAKEWAKRYGDLPERLQFPPTNGSDGIRATLSKEDNGKRVLTIPKDRIAKFTDADEFGTKRRIALVLTEEMFHLATFKAMMEKTGGNVDAAFKQIRDTYDSLEKAAESNPRLASAMGLSAATYRDFKMAPEDFDGLLPDDGLLIVEGNKLVMAGEFVRQLFQLERIGITTEIGLEKENVEWVQAAFDYIKESGVSETMVDEVLALSKRQIDNLGIRFQPTSDARNVARFHQLTESLYRGRDEATAAEIEAWKAENVGAWEELSAMRGEVLRAGGLEKIEPTDFKNPHHIKPPNAIYEGREKHVERMARQFIKNGYQGRPILLIGDYALTGSHRIHAARRANELIEERELEIDEIEVPVFELTEEQAQVFDEWIRESGESIAIDYADYHKTSGDDYDKASDLRRAHEAGVIPLEFEALMRAEEMSNDEVGGFEGFKGDVFVSPTQIKSAEPISPGKKLTPDRWADAASPDIRFQPAAESDETPTYEVYDRKTGEVVWEGKRRDIARQVQDRRDNAYGGYRFAVRETKPDILQQPALTEQDFTPAPLRDTATGFLPDDVTLDDLTLDFDDLADITEGLDPVNAENTVHAAVNHALARRAGEAAIPAPVRSEFDSDEAFDAATTEHAAEVARLTDTYELITRGRLTSDAMLQYRANPNALQRLVDYLTAAIKAAYARLTTRYDTGTAVALNRMSRDLAKARVGFNHDIEPMAAYDADAEPVRFLPATPQNSARTQEKLLNAGSWVKRLELLFKFDPSTKASSEAALSESKFIGKLREVFINPYGALSSSNTKSLQNRDAGMAAIAKTVFNAVKDLDAARNREEADHTLVQLAAGNANPVLTPEMEKKIADDFKQEIEDAETRIEDIFKNDISATPAQALENRRDALAEAHRTADINRSKAIWKARSEEADARRTQQLEALSILERTAPDTFEAIIDLRGAVNELQRLVKVVNPDNPELHAIIDQSQGVYLVRSYGIHNDPKQIDLMIHSKDPMYEQRRDALIGFFKPRAFEQIVEELGRDPQTYKTYGADVDYAKVKRDIEARAETLAEERAFTMFEDYMLSHQTTNGAFSQGSTVTNEIQRYMKKANMPQEFLDALMVNEDPVFNLANTAMSLGRLVWNSRMLNEIHDSGIESGRFITKAELDSGITYADGKEEMRRVFGIDGEYEEIKNHVLSKLTTLISNAAYEQYNSGRVDTPPDLAGLFAQAEEAMKAFASSPNVSLADVLPEIGRKADRIATDAFISYEFIPSEIRTRLNPRRGRFSTYKALVSENVGNSAFAPLGGLFASPEQVNAFSATFRINAMGAGHFADTFMQQTHRVIVGAAGFSLAVVTQGNPAFYLRNILGNTFTAAMSGVTFFNPENLALAARTARGLTSNSGKVTEEMQELIAARIINDGAHIGYMKQLFEDVTGNPMGTMEDIVSESALADIKVGKLAKGSKKAAKAFVEKLSQFSEASESVSAVMVYSDFKRILAEAEWGTETEIIQEASRLSKRVLPSRSETSSGVNAFTRSGFGALFSPFLRFRVDIIRSTVGAFKVAHEWSQSENPVLKKNGQTKMAAWFGTVALLTVGVPLIIQRALGFDDEDDKYIRAALPDYYKDSSLIYFRNEDKTGLTIVNTTFTNPLASYGDPISRIVNSVVSGNPSEIPGIMGRYITGDVLGENIVAGAVIDWKRNFDPDTGMPIYLETESTTDQALKVAAHLGKAYTPKIISQGFKFYDALRRESQEEGWNSPMGVALATVAPFKPLTKSFDEMDLKIFRSVHRDTAELSSITYPIISPYPTNAGDSAAAWEKRMDLRVKQGSRLLRLAEASVNIRDGDTGNSKNAVKRNMIAAGNSKKSVNSLLSRGVVEKVVLSKEQIQKANTIDPSRMREVLDAMSEYSRYIPVR